MLYGERRVCGGGRGCAQGIGGGVGVPNTDQLLTNLNNDLNLNASYLLNSYFQDDENIQQFFKTNLSSCYCDMQSFSNTYQNCKEPLFISLNIQSLNSKFSELKSFIAELGKVNIFIDLIILQETWKVVFSKLLELPGYQPLISRNRRNMRGGGVGVYVRKGLNFKVKNNFEIFRHKTFENITLELSYQNKNFLISNIYHSPNPPNGCTQQAHHNDFLDILDGHLSDLSGTDKDVYVFLDANIDLLKLNSLELARNYMDVNISNGFLQLITKATRIQGSHYSLIDHILTNTNLDCYTSGTIVSDLSDHFVNFIKLPTTKQKIKTKPSFRRNFSQINVNNFKDSLSNLSWAETLSKNDVNLAFDSFWNDFNALYDLNFPLTKFKFNKNVHKINDYLTSGLLISRKTKILLHKKAASERTIEANQKYRTYRNLFNTLVRKSKKMYFETNLNSNKKNPKKNMGIAQGGGKLKQS